MTKKNVEISFTFSLETIENVFINSIDLINNTFFEIHSEYITWWNYFLYVFKGNIFISVKNSNPQNLIVARNDKVLLWQSYLPFRPTFLLKQSYEQNETNLVFVLVFPKTNVLRVLWNIYCILLCLYKINNK